MERVSLRWRLILAALGRLPQGALSRAMGRLADLPIPRPLRSPVLGLLARLLGIDTSEAELPLAEYTSCNRFFVRRLKPGARPSAADPAQLVSPVDGIVGELGRISDGRLLQVKGCHYTAADLLDDHQQAARFEHGCFVTIYLSPRHYHRIHSPCTGAVWLARHVPGGLLPVNQPSLLMNPQLFVRNERLICYLEGAAGQVAVVAVGAFNVGRISAAFDPQWHGQGSGWVTNRRGAVPVSKRYQQPPEIERADEIMAFHLGSTVVLLFEPDRVELSAELTAGLEMRMGQPIATSTRG